MSRNPGRDYQETYGEPPTVFIDRLRAFLGLGPLPFVTKKQHPKYWKTSTRGPRDLRAECATVED